MKKIFFPLLAAIFFQGCEEKPVYSRFLQNAPYEMPSCIDLKEAGAYQSVVTRELLKEKIAVTENCPYTMTFFTAKSSCSPEKGGSAGFVRIELLKEGNGFYQIQSEYEKGEEADVAALLSKKMLQELKRGSL